MKPYVGADVCYQSYGTPGGEYPSVCRAAKITEVPDADLHTETGAPQPVGLAVFNPTGLFFRQNVPHDERGHLGGTWHWPEHLTEVDIDAPDDLEPRTVQGRE
jgi:hypothetical protein